MSERHPLPRLADRYGRALGANAADIHMAQFHSPMPGAGEVAQPHLGHQAPYARVGVKAPKQLA